MLDNKIITLLNQELDNVNSEKDRAFVKKLLEKNDEARQYFDELKAMAAAFQQVEEATPPSHLRNKILGAIPFRTSTVRTRPSAIQSFFRNLSVSMSFRYATVFASGAVAGIILVVLFNNIPPDTSNLAGTMGASRPPMVAEAEISLPQVSGTIHAKQSDGTVLTELNLQPQQSLDVVLEYDDQQLRFDSFHSAGSKESSIVVRQGNVKLTVNEAGTYVIGFLNKQERLPVLTAKLFSQDALLSTLDLRLNQETNN